MIENYELLANAIIVRAVKDFRWAYQSLKRFPDDKTTQSELRKIKRFFHSGFFKALTDLNGPVLLERIIEEIEGGEAGEVRTT